jgi:hypothetical protein
MLKNPEDIKKEEKKEQKQEVSIAVVRELPTQVVRTVKQDDGSFIHLVTTEEALAEILSILRDKK